MKESNTKICFNTLLKTTLLSTLMLSGLLSALNLQAAITLDEAKKVTLFGDVRLRAESDSRSDDNGNGDTDRNRLRVRARIGAGYKANNQWSGKLRFATNSESLNSPYKTFGTKDKGNGDFGLDQAYLTYTPIKDLDFLGGKIPLKFWQQHEQFWDEDINPDALAAVYKINTVTINGNYAVLEDGNWGSEISTTILQVVQQAKLNNVDYTVALGTAHVKFSNPSTYQAKDHWQLSGQLKSGKWLAGLDYLDSDANTESTAYVLQGRYKVLSDLELSLYYYHVEAFAPIGDGTYSQDNWPNPGNTGVSNFKGFRHTSVDVRYYDAQRIADAAPLQAQTTSDAIMSRNDHSRFQVNLTVKF